MKTLWVVDVSKTLVVVAENEAEAVSVARAADREERGEFYASPMGAEIPDRWENALPWGRDRSDWRKVGEIVAAEGGGR